MGNLERGGESKHNRFPRPAPDVAFLLLNGEMSGSEVAAEQVCAADEGDRCSGTVGRRLAGV